MDNYENVLFREYTLESFAVKFFLIYPIIGVVFFLNIYNKRNFELFAAKQLCHLDECPASEMPLILVGQEVREDLSPEQCAFLENEVLFHYYYELTLGIVMPAILMLTLWYFNIVNRQAIKNELNDFVLFFPDTNPPLETPEIMVKRTIIETFLNSVSIPVIDKSKLTEAQKSLLANYKDPITYEIMKDPVRLNYRYQGREYSRLYDRSSLQEAMRVKVSNNYPIRDPYGNTELLHSNVTNFSITTADDVRSKIQNIINPKDRSALTALSVSLSASIGPDGSHLSL